MSKVYVKTDEMNRIIGLDGGYTVENIDNVNDWTLIDEGDGDRYNLCAACYLPKSIADERGIYRYRYANGSIVERAKEEMDAEYEETPQQKSTEERIEELETKNQMLIDCILEMADIIYQ